MTETTVRDSMLGLPLDALGAMHRALAAGRSPVEAAEAARRLGYETGAGFHRALEQWVTATGGGDLAGLEAGEFWSLLSDFFSSQGWGRLDFEQLHPGVAALSSVAWAESGAENAAAHPSCHFTTGLLADLLGRASGAEPAVMEVECRSRGDARCRFLVGGRDALERVYEDLRAGESYTESVRRLD
jgi:hypothetical protein